MISNLLSDTTFDYQSKFKFNLQITMTKIDYNR